MYYKVFVVKILNLSSLIVNMFFNTWGVRKESQVNVNSKILVYQFKIKAVTCWIIKKVLCKKRFIYQGSLI